MAMLAQSSTSTTLNLNRCVMLALVHDLPRIDSTPSLEAIEQITNLLPPLSKLRILDLYREYTNNVTPEAKFVMDLARFEQAIQAIEYERRHDCQLQSFFESTVPEITNPEILGWTTELMHERLELFAQRNWTYTHLGPALPELERTASTSSAVRPARYESGMLGYTHTVENLKTNKRTGWVNRLVPLPESIADHMYRMAMIALVSEDPALDVPLCINMALVHDLAEADVGDITPFQVSGVTASDKHALEFAAMTRISSLLPHDVSTTSSPARSTPRERLLSYWREYEDRATINSVYVKDLDMFDLALQGVEYERAHQTEGLQSFFATTVPKIKHPTVKAWAHDLMEERRALYADRGVAYEHIDVAPDAAVPNGLTNKPEMCSIPLKVFGEHVLAL